MEIDGDRVRVRLTATKCAQKSGGVVGREGGREGWSIHECESSECFKSCKEYAV